MSKNKNNIKLGDLAQGTPNAFKALMDPEKRKWFLFLLEKLTDEGMEKVNKLSANSRNKKVKDEANQETSLRIDEERIARKIILEIESEDITSKEDSGDKSKLTTLTYG